MYKIKLLNDLFTTKFTMQLVNWIPKHFSDLVKEIIKFEFSLGHQQQAKQATLFIYICTILTCYIYNKLHVVTEKVKLLQLSSTHSIVMM